MRSKNVICPLFRYTSRRKGSGQFGNSPQIEEAVHIGIRQEGIYQLEPVPTIGYLGPQGTFSEEALRLLVGEQGFEAIPYPTLAGVVKGVADGQVAAGLLPLENSVEGAVNITLDLLAHQVDLLITGELALPIHHFLWGVPGAALESLTTIYSHPQALAQCRDYLSRHCPQAQVVAVESTGFGVAQVAAQARPDQGAIGTGLAGKLHHLQVLAANIEDSFHNTTRFVLVGHHVPPPTGQDKTSLVFSTPHQPGSLYRVLGELARRDINLARIESRPAKRRLGEYIFFADLEGHREDRAVAQALAAIQAQCAFFKFLGSYPRWKPLGAGNCPPEANL